MRCTHTGQMACWRRGPAPAASTGGCSLEVDVTSAIEIDRSRDVVAAFAADPSNATAWYENITSVTWETPAAPLAVGSRVAFEARFLGRRMAYTYEVAELVPGERLVMGTAQGPFPMETTYTWVDAPRGGTRMTLRNRGEPAGFTRVLGPAIARAMRSANRRDLEALKRLLEGG